MNQQHNGHEVYTIHNIRYALIHSNVPGVLALVEHESVYVPASDWKTCLQEINELTSSNWVGIRETQGDGTRVIYSKTFRCHRGGSYVPQRTERTGQKKNHDHYRPGDYRDRRTLKLTGITLEKIREQLRDGRNCREIRMALLRQFESVTDNSNNGQRKLTYNDVYNQLKQLKYDLFQFDDNDMRSVQIWLNERLRSDNYTIFNGDPSRYTTHNDIYSFGFLSPTQLHFLQQARSVCIDVTYNITTNVNDIMYTIVTRDLSTGTGYPNAFMFTNNHFAGPLKEWLAFLRDQYGLMIEQMTIDCSITEVNTIDAVFPAASIHYCAFYVVQSWNRNLKEKVHDPTYIASEQQERRHEMLSTLKDIMRYTDVNATYTAIEQFKNNYYADDVFLNYFEEHWEPDHIVQRWSYAYMDQRNRSFASNAFIESWHNQLKSVYLKHQERNRIMSNSDRMGPLQNEQSQREYRASLISANMILAMICNPHHENVSSPMTGIWIVWSFVTHVTRSTPDYNVTVNENMHIDSCNCSDYMHRHAPCKHMYLLRNFTSMQIQFEIEQEHAINMREAGTIQNGEFIEQNVVQQRIQQLPIETESTANNNDNIIENIDTTQDNLQFVSQTFSSLHHDSHRVVNLSTISEEESNEYAQWVRELLVFHQEMIQHHHHRRSGNTQRN
ncbi:hypothetical protein INT45_013278 [Circinella minor]|uniref:SWIM-type domain-containing protein n=1 Tax=Circinella minor TaxID=1195481 RepID=A0A8H7VAC5_9FUNG|nr:hypothetical protein INT45_013278 [Circinella minor]